ncbi:MAG: hypothetical protein AAB538_02355 [Patescibacteria group bacterium]
MAEINLAPGSEYLGLVRKRRRRVYAWTFLIAAAVAVVWGGLFVYQQQLIQKKREVDRRLAAVEAEITRLGDQATRVTLFEGRLAAVDDLLSDHVTWDPFLQDLERLLPPPAIVTRIEVNVTEGKVELGGETPDIDTVSQTLASLASTPSRPTIFSSATLENVNRVQQDNIAGEAISVRYEFAASLNFDTAKVRYGQ